MLGFRLVFELKDVGIFAFFSSSSHLPSGKVDPLICELGKYLTPSQLQNHLVKLQDPKPELCLPLQASLLSHGRSGIRRRQPATHL